MSAQIPTDASAEQLKKIKEDATARREAYEELKKADDARRAWDAAQDASKLALAEQSAAAKAAKDVADAQTSAANAQKAQSEAALAAIKAKFGDVPTSGYTGAVELGGGAGNAEAMLLGATAVNDIGARFADSIKAASSSVVLVTAATVPDFQALTAFGAQFESFRAAVVLARAKTDDSPAANAGVKLELTAAAVGLGFDAVSKLLSYAKTDYKFVGIDVSSTDAMLLQALAGRLMALGVTVDVPNLYLPAALTSTSAVLSQVSEVTGWSIEARRRMKLYETAQSLLENRSAGTPGDATVKSQLDRAKDALATWKAIADAIDAWAKQTTAADDKGNVPLAVLMRQSALRQALDGGAALVVVQLHKVAGTGYTKKNLWSSLGANPFFVMGGAVAGYVAMDGKTGHALSSMLLPLHGGYWSVTDVPFVVRNATR